MYHRSQKTAAAATSKVTPAHRSEVPESDVTQPSQHTPLSQLATHGCQPEAHAAVLRRTSGGQLTRNGPLLLQLQQQYGNRYVQRVVDKVRRADCGPAKQEGNPNGLPDHLKAAIEGLSGLSMDDVRVHYNSSKPAYVQALAYTQGRDIHVGPNQEHHVAHEAWHVVQQKQGRVKPTLPVNGVSINDDRELEKEADVMGRYASHLDVTGSPANPNRSYVPHSGPENVVQCRGGNKSKGARRGFQQAIEEGLDEVYGDWDEEDFDEEAPTPTFAEELAAAAAARDPEQTASAIAALEARRAGHEAAVRGEARRFGNEFRRLINEAARAADQAVDLSMRAGIVASRLGARGEPSRAMAREAEQSAALAALRAQDAREGESMARAATAHRLAHEAKQRATWAMDRATSNAAKVEAQRQSVLADTTATVAATIKTAGLVRRMMATAQPKDPSLLDRAEAAAVKANAAMSKARGAHKLDDAENALAEAAAAQELGERIKADTVTLLKAQAGARRAPAAAPEDDILAGPKWLRDYQANQRQQLIDKQRTASRHTTSPALVVNDALTIPGFKVLQWYQEVTKQALPGFYSGDTSDLTANRAENLTIRAGNWLDVWSKLRRREQARSSGTRGFGAVPTRGSSYPLIGQVGIGAKRFSVEEKLWVKPSDTGTASRYYEMANALAQHKTPELRAANIRKVLGGDLTGADAHEIEAALAMFGSEVARNPRSYGIGLMLLDLVENQARYGRGGTKAYTWAKILASHQHAGETERDYNRRKTAATAEKVTRWGNFTRTLRAQAPNKFHHNPTKTLWAGKWPMSPSASMSLGASQTVPAATTDLNVVQYRELKTILNWYIFMMKGEPLIAQSEAEAEAQLKEIFRKRLGSMAKAATLASDWW